MRIKNKTTVIFLFINILLLTQISFAQNASWNGTWTHPSRHNSGTLEISNVTSKQFKFKLFSLNGANMGEIVGFAQVDGKKAIYDDRKDKSHEAESYGCIVTFIKKKDSIEIETNNKCRSYGGMGVYFDKEYKKGVNLPKTEENLIQRNIFPDAKTNANFKKLTGKDYENFLDSFQLISKKEDLDGLGTKVFSGCVRGVCPYNAGIIMFDKKGNFYAMVFDSTDELVDGSYVFFANYYSNNKKYADKLPLTIQKWYDAKVVGDEKFKIHYKNKP